METVADSRGAIRGRHCARRSACCILRRLQGERFQGHPHSPAPYLRGLTSSHLRPAHAPTPNQRASPLPGLSQQPCVPSPTPGPDSFHPRGPICWEEPPTPHLSSHFLVPIPGSVAVLSSGKPVVIEAMRRADFPDNRLPSPRKPLFLQPPGFGEMPTAWCRRPSRPSSEPRVRMCEQTRARTLCASARGPAGSGGAWRAGRTPSQQASWWRPG